MDFYIKIISKFLALRKVSIILNVVQLKFFQINDNLILSQQKSRLGYTQKTLGAHCTLFIVHFRGWRIEENRSLMACPS
jgi:hypothetical protein